MRSCRASIFYASLLAILSPYTAQSDNKRIVGYWESWGPTPTVANLANYTHMNLAFLESSDRACTINADFDARIVSILKKANIKVIGSVGGYSMNKYWSYCTVDKIVDQLMQHVDNFGLDGIDIDYEVDPPVHDFVVNLHKMLKKRLGTGKLLTHAPENNQMVVDGTYWTIVAAVADQLDYISVQYYNDRPNPVTNPDQAIAHYTDIVNKLFGGDASKVVFGFCITDCSDWNISGKKAAAIVQKLLVTFPNMGGIMNWAENQGDIDGTWSSPSAALLRK